MQIIFNIQLSKLYLREVIVEEELIEEPEEEGAVLVVRSLQLGVLSQDIRCHKIMKL